MGLFLREHGVKLRVLGVCLCVLGVCFCGEAPLLCLMGKKQSPQIVGLRGLVVGMRSGH